MSYQSSTPFINVELDANCLTIEFNRPDALNALRPEMLSEAARLVGQANSDEDVMVIVLRGAGRAFSAGVDLKVLQGIEPQGGIIGNVFDDPAAQLAAAIRDTGVPVIARAVGACFTGALEVALHCDFVYTTDTTKFGDTHTKFGLRPTWGMSQTLSRAVGQRRARELSFTAKIFTGAQAVEWGIANDSFETPEALDEALAATCAQITANSAEAVAAMKDLYRLAENEDGIRASLKAETSSQYSISDTEERLSAF
jgi:enoyl-CoA hydratase/carnithine racemase